MGKINNRNLYKKIQSAPKPTGAFERGSEVVYNGRHIFKYGGPVDDTKILHWIFDTRDSSYQVPINTIRAFVPGSTDEKLKPQK